MIHLHKWPKWGAPYQQPMAYRRNGETLHGHEDKQRRTCTKCNATQERTL